MLPASSWQGHQSLALVLACPLLPPRLSTMGRPAARKAMTKDIVLKMIAADNTMKTKDCSNIKIDQTGIFTIPSCCAKASRLPSGAMLSECLGRVVPIFGGPSGSSHERSKTLVTHLHCEVPGNRGTVNILDEHYIQVLSCMSAVYVTSVLGYPLCNLPLSMCRAINFVIKGKGRVAPFRTAGGPLLRLPLSTDWYCWWAKAVVTSLSYLRLTDSLATWLLIRQPRRLLFAPIARHFVVYCCTGLACASGLHVTNST